MESEVYKQLSEKIDAIMSHIQKHTSKETLFDDEWMDEYDVCTYLHISERTLQRLRKNGDLAFSKINGKVYYSMDEIKRMLKERLIRSNSDHLASLLEQQHKYFEARKRRKPTTKQ